MSLSAVRSLAVLRRQARLVVVPALGRRAAPARGLAKAAPPRTPGAGSAKPPADAGSAAAATASAAKAVPPKADGRSGARKAWDWWTSDAGETPAKWTAEWAKEWGHRCVVFAFTGSSTMVLVRPAITKGLGLEGTMKDGPWSYRIASFVLISPVYAALLLCYGTAFGRHWYFRRMSVKIWSRFGIPPQLLDPVLVKRMRKLGKPI